MNIYTPHCRQDSSLPQTSQQAEAVVGGGGQVYRNAMYTEGVSSPHSLVATFEHDHYVTSTSSTDHTYESITDIDLNNGEYHRYALLEKYTNSQSHVPSVYDKLDPKSEAVASDVVPTGTNLKDNTESTQGDTHSYAVLEAQANRDGRCYNRQQQAKYADTQFAENEEHLYDQTDPSEVLSADLGESVDYQNT